MVFSCCMKLVANHRHFLTRINFVMTIAIVENRDRQKWVPQKIEIEVDYRIWNWVQLARHILYHHSKEIPNRWKANKSSLRESAHLNQVKMEQYRMVENDEFEFLRFGSVVKPVSAFCQGSMDCPHIKIIQLICHFMCVVRVSLPAREGQKTENPKTVVDLIDRLSWNLLSPML